MFDDYITFFWIKMWLFALYLPTAIFKTPNNLNNLIIHTKLVK